MNRPIRLWGGADARMRPVGQRAGAVRSAGGRTDETPVRMAPVRALGMREGETYE